MNMTTMFNDVDDFMNDNPRDKFFDIIFQANNDIVRLELEKIVQQFVAMESMLEKIHGEELDSKIRNEIYEDPDKNLVNMGGFYMTKMGNILSQSEQKMRGLAIFVILSTTLFGRYWDSQYDVTLKKDEVSEYQIIDPIRLKKFTFRWTLYINDGLVVLANYDGYPYQFILYKRANGSSFQIPLKKKRSFLMVEFYDFDVKKKEAKFRTLFKNSKAEIIEKSNW